MSAIVVAASVALAWCFPDEASEYADTVLVALEGHPVLVPAIWALEVTNAVVVAERRKRIRRLEIRRFFELLSRLTIDQESQPVAANITYILPLAREYGLSAYDASYFGRSTPAWRATGDPGRRTGKSGS